MSGLDKQSRLTAAEFAELEEFCRTEAANTSRRQATLRYKAAKVREYLESLRVLDASSGNSGTLENIEASEEAPVADISDLSLVNPYTSPVVSAAVDDMTEPLRPVLGVRRQLQYETGRAYDCAERLENMASNLSRHPEVVEAAVVVAKSSGLFEDGEF